MARLSRAQQHEHARAALLAAAHAEFAEHGYDRADADRIAERANLTRGAVDADFPSKRALYLAVLLRLAEVAPGRPAPRPPKSVSAAVAEYAADCLQRVPVAGTPAPQARLQLFSLTGVAEDQSSARLLDNLMMLESLLLGLGLERLDPPRKRRRRVRMAQLVLTMLDGAAARACLAPGNGDLFDIVRACEHLSAIAKVDSWDPPHLALAAPATVTQQPWQPPDGLTDLLSDSPADLTVDGVIVALGAHRLGAAEEAVRAARPEDHVRVIALTGDPAETGRLVRLRLTDQIARLRRTIGQQPWDTFQLILDEDAATSPAFGVDGAGDEVEVAVRIRHGMVVARAEGSGAGHVVAKAV